MNTIIDRRLNSGKKSTVNRQRFLQRHRRMIRKAVQDTINKRSITDMDRGDDIRIPQKDLSEPWFHHGPGGQSWQVHPGNKKFHAGDRIEKPPDGGQGGGNGKASDSGEGVDNFVFQINREEFLEYVFEGLALPNLVCKALKDSTEYKYRRGGISSAGSPERLNIVRSLKAAHARRIALTGKERKEIRELKRELRALELNPDKNDPEREEVLRRQIRELNKKLKRLPFIDEFDLRFNNLIKVPQPSGKAVMFCIMDVSGSMTQTIKEIAKRFFMLLYLFLKRHYEAVQVVFIRHHTDAKECSEDEFFYARETGGTRVSTALKLTHDIIVKRYPSSAWNIYIAQASDGDNWGVDMPLCQDILVNQLLPCTQYFAYVEIADQPQGLWQTYEAIARNARDRFALQRIKDQQDIYPVFRRLFEKEQQ